MFEVKDSAQEKFFFKLSEVEIKRWKSRDGNQEMKKNAKLLTETHLDS